MKNSDQKIEEIKDLVTELAKSLDSLAVATANGFNGVFGRMDSLENEMVGVKLELKSTQREMREGFAKVDHDISTIHEAYVRKDDLKRLSLL